MIEEYVDDWYCRNCENGPLSQGDDCCPECGTKWNENFPETEQYKKAIQNLSNNSLSEITKVIRQQEKERLEIAKLELLMRRRRKTI